MITGYDEFIQSMSTDMSMTEVTFRRMVKGTAYFGGVFKGAKIDIEIKEYEVDNFYFEAVDSIVSISQADSFQMKVDGVVEAYWY